MEQEPTWTKVEEARWKRQIKELFATKLNAAYAEYGSPLEVGNHLGEILRSVELEAVRLVVPRAARKWASPENRELWEEIIRDEQKLFELRVIGTSVANTLRPLAGNTFAEWVMQVLNVSLEEREIPVRCITKGPIKHALGKRLIVQDLDYKPDIDIVVVQVPSEQPVAIISVKTTLAERVMQTINWRRFKEQLPQDVRSIKLYLVTAWETYGAGNANRTRVQELDGVYVCNPNANLYGVIKPFSALIEDLQQLL